MTTATIKRRLDKLAPVTSEDGYSLWVGRPLGDWPSSALISFLIGQPVDAARRARLDGCRRAGRVA